MALKYLIEAGGNYRKAAQMAEGTVSLHYLRDLACRPEHRPFRQKFHEETGKLLDAMEIDERYILEAIVGVLENTEADKTRLRAAEILAKIRGMFTDTTVDVGVNLSILQDKRIGFIVNNFRNTFDHMVAEWVAAEHREEAVTLLEATLNHIEEGLRGWQDGKV